MNGASTKNRQLKQNGKIHRAKVSLYEKNRGVLELESIASPEIDVPYLKSCPTHKTLIEIWQVQMQPLTQRWKNKPLVF